MFPWLIGMGRLRQAHKRFFDVVVPDSARPGKVRRVYKGYHGRIAELQDRHKGELGFIVANGPSLRNIDLDVFADKVTIGSNGVYSFGGPDGFPTYFTMEDWAQVYDRRKDFASIRSEKKIFALYNAAHVRADNRTLFANVEPDSHGSSGRRFSDIYPQFSRDFASVVYQGATITYINLQLAFFLGMDPVVIVGLDHNYGSIVDRFPPGKITVTHDVMAALSEVHAIPDYHSLGGTFGVPHVKLQEAAYLEARRVFDSYGRTVLNATPGTHLDVFEKVRLEEIL